MNFSATIEFLTGQSAAIVTLYDSTGEWSGSGRIECRSGGKSSLYEQGYIHASRSATAKGGRLDRYRVIPDEDCPKRIEPPTERRPGNALNVEIGSPAPRCAHKSPDGRGLTWILSGGSPLAYGLCTPNACPMPEKAA